MPLELCQRHTVIGKGDYSGMSEGSTRLRYARRARKLTQVQLAKASGLTQASISDLETGQSKSFRGMTLVALASALRVNPEWLMHGKGPMERQNLPLSDRAVTVAQAWQRLAPEVQEKIADMILAMAEQADKFGPAVEDARVEAAYGKPPKQKP